MKLNQLVCLLSEKGEQARGFSVAAAAFEVSPSALFG